MLSEKRLELIIKPECNSWSNKLISGTWQPIGTASGRLFYRNTKRDPNGYTWWFIPRQDLGGVFQFTSTRTGLLPTLGQIRNIAKQDDLTGTRKL